MVRNLLQFMRSLGLPTFILGRGRDARGRTTSVRNGQFVSFMAMQGCSRRQHPDRHDRRLQFQKTIRAAMMLAAGLGLAWFALESAKALSLF